LLKFPSTCGAALAEAANPTAQLRTRNPCPNNQPTCNAVKVLH
jgi:hypothetical protein